MKLPRAILLDLDDTLLDRGKALARCLGGWIDAAGRAADPAQRAAWLQQALALDEHGTAPRPQFWARLWRLPAFADVDPSSFGQERFRRDLLDGIEPDAAVLALLRQLAARWPLAIVTNGDDWMQRHKAQKAQVDGAVQFVLTSGSLGCHKPDPRIFQTALQALGVAAADALMVGDNPDTDIAGAMGCGMQAVWIAHGRSWPEDRPHRPDAVVDHVLQLPQVLP